MRDALGDRLFLKGSASVFVFPPPLWGRAARLALKQTRVSEARPSLSKRFVAPGGGRADSFDPPPAHVSLASPPLRVGSLGNARDLPHKGGGGKQSGAKRDVTSLSDGGGE